MVTITYSMPNTGFSAPSTEEASRLLRIVDAACPWLALVASVDLDEYRRAMAGVGLMFRTAGPSTKLSIGHFIDSANEILSTHGRGGSIGAVAFLGACFDHGDICWRKADASVGQLLEIGLDRYAGRKCSNRWRDLLTGSANIVAPMPARAEFVDRAARGQPQATFWSQGQNGLKQVSRGDPLWARVRES